MHSADRSSENNGPISPTPRPLDVQAANSHTAMSAVYVFGSDSNSFTPFVPPSTSHPAPDTQQPTAKALGKRRAHHFDSESEPSSSDYSSAYDSDAADSDYCELVSESRPGPSIRRSPSTAGPSQPPRQIYTILDSEDESENEVELLLLSGASASQAAAAKKRRPISIPDSDDSEDDVVLMLHRPTVKSSSTAGRDASAFSVNASRQASSSAQPEPAFAYDVEDLHDELLSACMAEYCSRQLPERLYDLYELHKEWKDKVKACDLSDPDKDLLRSLLFDKGAASHHPLRYFSVDSTNPSEDIHAYTAPAVFSMSNPRPADQPRTFLSEAQVNFLVYETHTLLSMSPSRNAQAARFHPTSTKVHLRQEIRYLQPAVIAKFPSYSSKSAGVTFKSKLHRMRQERTGTTRDRRKRRAAHKQAQRLAEAEAAEEEKEEDTDEESSTDLEPAPKKKRQRSEQSEKQGEMRWRKRIKVSTTLNVPCWKARPCIRGRQQMRQMVQNAKMLVKRLSQQTGAILSIDTEGTGHNLSEFGYALHRWFREGDDLQEPAANRRLDPFEADLAKAIQLSLAESDMALDLDATVTVPTPTKSNKGIQEETVIRHFWHPALRKARYQKFLLGKSEILHSEHVKSRLEGIFKAVNLDRHCVLLIAHAPFAELEALQMSLDIDTASFQWLDGTKKSNLVEEPKGIVLIDTQQLMQCYQRSGQALNLHDACTAMGIDTVKLHNAANDGWFAMELLQAILNA